VNEVAGALIVDEDLYVSGRIFCNGLTWSAVNNYIMQDGIVTGKTTFCNAIVDGILTIGKPGTRTAFSNVPDGATMIEDDLYVSGRVYCNGFSMTSCNVSNYYVNAVEVNGFFTSHCNSAFYGNAAFHGPTSFESPITMASSLDVAGSLTVDGPLTMNGSVDFGNSNLTFLCSNVTFTSNASFHQDIYFWQNYANVYGWMIGLSNSTPFYSDLMFKSRNNTTVTFTDNFTSEVLNFTGKHRCSTDDSFINKKNISEYIGKIVIATGRYQDLDGKNIIHIDEALPCIELSQQRKDTRVFGVISDVENNGSTRTFKLGNLSFEHHKQVVENKVIVNSVGEGAILVCNINGDFKNGDLIATSIIPGLGELQTGKTIKSYTVAKITCDCSFDLNSTTYKCESFMHDGQIYRSALVGCVYKC
jgi:hypothetical protein